MNPLRTLVAGVVLAALIVGLRSASAPAQNPAPQSPSMSIQATQVIDLLSHTISWYRRLAVEQQLANEPADLTFVNENRRIAAQVVTLAFDFARGQAQLQAKQPAKTSAQAGSSDAQQYQALFQAAQKTDQDIQDTQNELDTTRAKLAKAVGAKERKLLESQVAELQSEIGLLQARRDALNSMVEFVNSSTTGAGGLRAQIEELARSVPASLSHPQGTAPGETTPEPSATTNAAAARRPQPSGIWGLAADLVHLSGKRSALSDESSATQELSRTCKDIRKPLLDALRNMIGQGNQLFSAADTATPDQLAQQRQQLDALTSQFKQVSSTLLPVSKMIVLLDIYQKTLVNWREAIDSEAHDELRQLLLRLGVLLVLIAAVFIVGEIWRRTTFRYIHEARRRYQFLLLRRIIMWAAIALIVTLAFATQLGSAVTFAGLITAGVAVALQNVIVSIVAYFFLIGKYGVRVGDRVQVAGVNGEVVDLGLVRLHVMELGPDSQPTGRVVALSNSIVFQPTAGLFKQIPGTNFVWHEMKLTLASETDYHTAKERISAAVNEVLGVYRESLEAQRRSMEKNLTSVSSTEFKPKIRLHYTASGIEADVRYPVALDKAAEIDDHLMRGVMAALDKEPRLRLVGAEMPTVKAGD